MLQWTYFSFLGTHSVCCMAIPSLLVRWYPSTVITDSSICDAGINRNATSCGLKFSIPYYFYNLATMSRRSGKKNYPKALSEPEPGLGDKLKQRYRQNSPNFLPKSEEANRYGVAYFLFMLIGQPLSTSYTSYVTLLLDISFSCNCNSTLHLYNFSWRLLRDSSPLQRRLPLGLEASFSNYLRPVILQLVPVLPEVCQQSREGKSSTQLAMETGSVSDGWFVVNRQIYVIMNGKYLEIYLPSCTLEHKPATVLGARKYEVLCSEFSCLQLLEASSSLHQLQVQRLHQFQVQRLHQLQVQRLRAVLSCRMVFHTNDPDFLF